MSVDIEGAEYEALRTFPFDSYRIGALTVEHNDAQERRDGHTPVAGEPRLSP